MNVMWMIVLGRLRHDVSVEAAENELTALWRHFYQAPEGPGYAAVLTPFSESILGGTHAALLGTLGAVAILCLIACLNVTALHILRTTERHPELAVRQALGATRGRLVSNLFGEGLLVAALGGIGGVVVAFAATPLLVAMLPAEIPRLDQVVVGQRVLAFSIAVSCLAGLLSSIGSAVAMGDVSLSQASSRTVSRRNEFRTILVVAEIAAAVVLSVAAALMARTLINLKNVPLGFEQSVLALQVSPQGPMSRNRAFYQELLQRVRHLPSVEAASAITQRPLWNTVGNDWVFVLEGQSAREAERNPMLNLMAVSSDYFRTLGIPILRGRALVDADAPGQPGVVVISESLARRLWPGQDVIGKRLQMPLGDSPYHNSWLSVVGVVGDARYRELQATRFDAYISYLQADHRLSHLMIRTRDQPAGLAASVRAVVHDIDRNVPITETTTMAQVVSRALSTPTFVATSFGLFAVAAAVLAGLGLYGLVAYALATRTREIGVRMALGAVPRHILTKFVREGVRLALLGGAIGIAAAFGAATLMSSLVFGLSVHDPVSFVLAPLLLILVAVTATILPARRAARVDPLVALRYE
jgi:predicted permease